jgi:hypothetical protein
MAPKNKNTTPSKKSKSKKLRSSFDLLLEDLDELKLFLRHVIDHDVFELLMGFIRAICPKLSDNRAGHHNTKYSMEEVIIGALSVFFFQNASFLEQQRAMNKSKGMNNLRTIFKVEKIPTDTLIRSILDGIEAKQFAIIFEKTLSFLTTKKVIKTRFHSEQFGTLIALDGTRYFTSSKINCKNCNTTKHSSSKVDYYHSMVTPVIVFPEVESVIPMFPEFNTPQDGSLKQDSEMEAAKRIIKKNESLFTELKATLLGDDLYSHQPFCKLLLDNKLNFIFTCKADSHKVLYNKICDLEKNGGVSHVKKRVKQKRANKFTDCQYRYVNDLPIKGGADSINVNWFEVVVSNNKGKQVYKNSFATNFKITDENILELEKAARARWKVENENNNTLKTKGYNLEHNFGHGEDNLSQVLATLNIMAFLFHTTLELTDPKFEMISGITGKRTELFQHLRSLTVFLCFSSWDSLADFIILSMADYNMDISTNTPFDSTKLFDPG